MRILINCNEYPPAVHGGIGTFTKDLAEGLVAEGNEVHVIGIYQDISAEVSEKINGVNVIRKKGSQKKHPILRFLHNVFLLNLHTWQLARKIKADIVEVPEYLGSYPFGKWFSHSPMVVRLHGAAIFFDKILKRQGNRHYHLTEKLTIRKADHLVAVSDFCGRETLKFCNIRNRDYTVIYNAIDLSSLVNESADYNSHQIVFANTVNEKKGVIELVKAFNIVGRKYHDATLVIIGKTLHTRPDGTNIRDYLYSIADPVIAQRLNITGWLSSRAEVLDYLKKAHVCVYPSHMEGFGIAPAEAMALDKPTVYMKTGPGPEVIDDGLNGLLCDTFSPEDIAGKIMLIFDDEDLRQRLVTNARKKVTEKFNKHTWIQENILLYNKLLNRK